MEKVNNTPDSFRLVGDININRKQLKELFQKATRSRDRAVKESATILLKNLEHVEVAMIYDNLIRSFSLYYGNQYVIVKLKASGKVAGFSVQR